MADRMTLEDALTRLMDEPAFVAVSCSRHRHVAMATVTFDSDRKGQKRKPGSYTVSSIRISAHDVSAALKAVVDEFREMEVVDTTPTQGETT